MDKRRLVGIDFGTKRIGVAVSDPLRIFARPHGTYQPEQVLTVLDALQQVDGIERFIVGWPLTLDGEEGPSTERVERFIERLGCRFPDIPIIRWDERFTSEMARNALLEAGVSRKARSTKGRVDAAAAAIILQEYLDEIAAGGNPLEGS